MVRADNVVESTVQVWSESGAAADRFRNFFLDRYAEAYRREMDHFADILDGAVPMVGYEDGVAALELAEAAARSLAQGRSEEHTSELQSLMRISYAVFCLKKKKQNNNIPDTNIKPK